MLISQQYRQVRPNTAVCHFVVYLCHLIENESLVASTDKKFSQTMVTYAKILQNNPPVQLNYRLNFSIWKTEIIAKIINEKFFITINNSCHVQEF